MIFRKLLIGALAVTTLAGASAAFADTPWQAHHPRREEVNHRLGNLNHSIREERREGDISGWQAARLHARAHRIRMQERRFASRDGGHITRHEQRFLNHEENGVRAHVPG